jgi:cytochrome P450
MLELLQRPNFFQNPYIAYQQIRKIGLPVWLPIENSTTTTKGTWLFFNYDDINELIQDSTRLSNDLEKNRQSEISNPYDLIMLLKDGDVHNRLRSIVSQFFTQKSVLSFSSDIVSMTNNQLDALCKKKSFDAVGDYATVLPIKVMLKMLGLPEKDWIKIRNWTLELHDLSDSLLVQGHKSNLHVLSEVFTYAEQSYEARFTQDEPFIIALLYEAELAGEISRGEVFAMLVLMLVAGNATTSPLISSTLWLLLSHPSQMETLRSNQSFIDQALNETLRFESPAQRTFFRVATSEINLRRFNVQPGQQISLVLGSAHRDTSFYDQPDLFDITRNGKSNLAFGKGIHTCLGKHLALLSARIILGGLLERFPNLELIQEHVLWRNNSMFRELESLPVRII